MCIYIYIYIYIYTQLLSQHVTRVSQCVTTVPGVFLPTLVILCKTAVYWGASAWKVHLNTTASAVVFAAMFSNKWCLFMAHKWLWVLCTKEPRWKKQYMLVRYVLKHGSWFELALSWSQATSSCSGPAHNQLPCFKTYLTGTCCCFLIGKDNLLLSKFLQKITFEQCIQRALKEAKREVIVKFHFPGGEFLTHHFNGRPQLSNQVLFSWPG